MGFCAVDSMAAKGQRLLHVLRPRESWLPDVGIDIASNGHVRAADSFHSFLDCNRSLVRRASQAFLSLAGVVLRDFFRSRAGELVACRSADAPAHMPPLDYMASSIGKDFAL